MYKNKIVVKKSNHNNGFRYQSNISILMHTRWQCNVIEGGCEKETLIYSFLLFYLNIELNINKKFPLFFTDREGHVHIDINENRKKYSKFPFCFNPSTKKGIKGK